ncbi:MAG: flagellar hook-length control protein FliK, partial [Planctomycetota bacterium]
PRPVWIMPPPRRSTPTSSATQQALAAATTGNNQGESSDAPPSEGEPNRQAAKPEAGNARAANAAVSSTFTPTAPTAADPASNAPQPANQAPGPNAPASAQPTPRSDGPDALNEARLARGLKSALNQQGGTVTLRLTPPEMGTVRIQMQLQGTQVTAQFHAETGAARNLLQQQLGQLRTALEGQGLSVDRLGVQSMSAANAGGASSFNGNNLNQQNQAFGQNHNDANQNPDGRSRGFFQQSRGDADTSGRPSDNTPDDFAELVADLN